MRFSALIKPAILCLVILFALLFVKTPAFAQNAAVIPTTDSSVPNNLHTWTQNVMIETLSAIACQLSGSDPIDQKHGCLGVDLKSGKIGYTAKNGGAIGLVGQGISMLYTPPLHTSDYINHLAQNFGLTKKTYAASGGYGFGALAPVMDLWIKLRNIAYLVFVFVFMIVGMGIMLRVKLDPRTVMTIQNQIPKIITCLILITFSFAIAGLLIDLMYICIFIIYNVFQTPSITSSMSPAMIQGQNVIQLWGNLNLFDLINKVAGEGSGAINNIIGVSPASSLPGIGDLTNVFSHLVSTVTGGVKVLDIVYDIISVTTAIKIGLAIGQAAKPGIPVIDFFASTGGGLAAGAVVFTFMEQFLRNLLPYLIIYIIVLLAVFATLIRVFIMLLKAYVSIILDVIFAPFWIIAGLVPGSDNSKGFGSWLKDILSNLAVFPVVYAMFLLANVIKDAFNNAPGNSFVPPLVGNPVTSGLIGAITAIGLILLTPDVAQAMKTFLKAPKVQFGAIGQGIGTGFRVSKNTGKAIQGIRQQAHTPTFMENADKSVTMQTPSVGNVIKSRLGFKTTGTGHAP